jgi:hypothetical protein
MAGTIRGGCGIGSEFMKQKTAGQVVVIVLLAGLSVWMLRRSSNEPRIDLNPYQTLGVVAGEEVSQALGHRGEIVIVMPDPGPKRDAVMDAQLAAFRNGLKKAGNVEVRATETVKMDPFQSMRTGGAIPPERLLELSRKHSDVAALILFIPFPFLDGRTATELKSPRRKLMVVSESMPFYEELIEQGVLNLAIVPRAQPAEPSGPASKTIREAFAGEYQILRGIPAP